MRHHQIAIEAHAHAVLVHVGTSVSENFARFPKQKVDTDPLEQFERRLVNRLELVGGEDLQRRVGIAQLLEGQLRNGLGGSGTSAGACPLAGSSTHRAMRIAFRIIRSVLP